MTWNSKGSRTVDEKDGADVYVIVKNYTYEDEEVITYATGWDDMLNKIHPLRYDDPFNSYIALLRKDYDLEL